MSDSMAILDNRQTVIVRRLIVIVAYTDWRFPGWVHYSQFAVIVTALRLSVLSADIGLVLISCRCPLPVGRDQLQMTTSVVEAGRGVFHALRRGASRHSHHRCRRVVVAEPALPCSSSLVRCSSAQTCVFRDRRSEALTALLASCRVQYNAQPTCILIRRQLRYV